MPRNETYFFCEEQTLYGSARLGTEQVEHSMRGLVSNDGLTDKITRAREQHGNDWQSHLQEQYDGRFYERLQEAWGNEWSTRLDIVLQGNNDGWLIEQIRNESYYQDYWCYYQYPDPEGNFQIEEYELRLSENNKRLICGIVGEPTREYLLEHAVRSWMLITLFFRHSFSEKDYKPATLEFRVSDALHNKIECFTGTLTGLRDTTVTQATYLVLFVLKTAKNFQRIEDKRVQRFFDKAPFSIMEPPQLKYFRLDDI